MEKHDTILLSCTDTQSRSHLRFVLNERYNLLEAGNLRQTLLLLEQNLDCIAAVVMGSSVFSDLVAQRGGESDGLLGQIPVIVITEQEEELSSNLGVYFQRGAFDVIPLHYDGYAMLRRIETITQLHLHRQHLESVAQEQADRLRRANDDMVDVLSSIIEYRSMESGLHIRRIRNYSRILLEEVMRHCPEYRLTQRIITIISSASALHDVGKIVIPDAILASPNPLTPEQWEVMKTHTTSGCTILDALGSMADQEYLRYARNICLYHHERWDGSGYPMGLSGDQIPICAQVVGLADAYEALTSKRSYKDAYSFQQAVNMILQGKCGAFSPNLLECFKNTAERLEALTQEYEDGTDGENTAFDMTLPPPMDEPENSLSRTRAKYYTLVHYIGALLVEVNLEHKLFHVVYNPYPEIVRLDGITTLDQLNDLIIHKIVVPQEREAMQALIYQYIPDFVSNNLRRSTHYFHYQSEERGEELPFEMTLMRIDAPNRRSLALLFRKLDAPGCEDASHSQNFSLPQAGSSYICRNDRHFTLVHMRADAAALVGYTPEEIQTGLGGRLLELIHPQDRAMVREEFTSQLRSGTIVRLEHRIVFRNGTVRWVANKSQCFLGDDGQEYLHCFLTDITQMRGRHALLQDQYRMYGNILAQTQTILFRWDVCNDRFMASESWNTVFAVPPPAGNIDSWFAGNPWFHPDDMPLLLDRIANLRSGSRQETVEVRISTEKGQYVWCRFRMHAGMNAEGSLTDIIGVILNIDPEKQAERLLKVQADQDSLTKLLNKAAGKKQIETYLRYYPEGVSCAMLILDMDNFKQINDQYGHLFGDAVLAKVAHEIRRQFMGQDIVCRIGGDEFLVLVRGLSDQRLLEDRCTQLIASIRDCLRGQSKKLALSCSIGVALAPEHGTTYYDLFNHADQALYQAKALGKNGFCFYVPKAEIMQSLAVSDTALSLKIDSDEEPGLAGDSIIRHVFGLLHSARDANEGVNKVIALLGTRTNVSRVYIFENTPDNKYCSNTFEWCNQGIRPEIQNLQRISYETDIPNYEDNFDEAGVFYCPNIKVLPKTVYDIVAPQNIQSMLHCAIRQDGVFRGYIGFDECVAQRLWTKEEIQLLTYFSEVLSVFLMKHREQEKLRQLSDDLQTLLNNQNSCIYIIDPDTFELQYSNQHTRKILPGAGPGVPCYRGVMDRDTPCENCPARNIRETRTCRVLLRDQKYDVPLLAEATMIHWHGKDSCLITCKSLPKEM